MNKFYSLALAAILTPAIAMADATDAEYFDNYAAFSGTSSFGSGRGCSQITVSDNLGASLQITGPGYASHAIFTDATENILTTQAGATLTFTGTSTNAEWMHNYVFIDFGNDGRFDVDLYSTELNGDLVAFTGYSLDMKADQSDTADPTEQSNGDATNNGNYWSMPTVTLPADMKPGTYRVRLKNDWNSVHPYGRCANTIVGGQSTNAINANGGYIVDFTLVVEGEEVTEPVETYDLWIFGEAGPVAIYSDPEFQNLVAYDNDSADGQELTFTSNDCKNGLYIVTYPSDQISLKSLWINGSYYTSLVENNVYYIADVNSIPYFDSMGLQISATYEPNLSGIEEVAVDLNADDVEYFNLQGIRVATENLSTGIYVARQGNKTTKVIVK